MGFRRSRWEPDIRTIPGLWSFRKFMCLLETLQNSGGGTTKDPPRADDCRLDGACIIHGPSVPSHHGALLEDQDSGSGSVRVSRVGMPTSSLPAWAFHCACIQFHTGWPLRIAAGL